MEPYRTANGTEETRGREKTGGPSSEEVRERREKWGENRLAEEKKVGLLLRVLRQLADPMVLVLIGAAIVSAIGSGEEGRAEVFVILFVVALNTLLGVLQESKAEASLRALKEMTPALCRVIRDGAEKQIPTSALVPGDLVLIEAGDAIPADGRVVEAFSLSVEEAALTGEAASVEKVVIRDGEGGDRHRGEVFLGSCAVRGRGKMIVTQIGMHTEMGKIAASISEPLDDKTPLQKKLASLSVTLTTLVLVICAITFAIGWWRAGEWSAAAALRAFLLAVSLAVAAIPEGLVAVVTIVLSMGVSRMAKRNAIVRKLTAVEALGCTQVICTDKTGTLTQNRMTVQAAVCEGDARLMASAMALCNDASWNEERGDPTERALIAYAKGVGLQGEVLRKAYPRIGEIPFDSERRCMTTFHRTEEGVMQFTKGAPDVILGMARAWIAADGSIRSMSEEKRRSLLKQNQEFASGALRVMAAGYRILPFSKGMREVGMADARKSESDLIFLGMVGMMDPIREEVPQAIATCRKAGIRVVMITGDHPETARAIANQLGLPAGAGEVLIGDALEGMDMTTLRKTVERYSVFARVRPEHKTRIVDAWRACGRVTAMTGDGVNDAPAIKHSDIGIGMGISGTDVTKGCADLILADDHFETIVLAVEEGRRIYENICKAIHFLLSSNLSEVIVVFLGTLAGVTVLKPIHLLFINLITDSLPALALGMEKAEAEIMTRRPRETDEGIFSDGAPWAILKQGIAAAALTMAAFVLGCYLEAGGGDMGDVMRNLAETGGCVTGRTMAFLTMALAETFHSLNMRSRTHSIFELKTKNSWLTAAWLSSLVLTATLLYLPALSNLFQLEPIPFSSYMLCVLLAGLMIPIVELGKLVRRKKRKRTEK